MPKYYIDITLNQSYIEADTPEQAIEQAKQHLASGLATVTIYDKEDNA